MAVTSRGYRRTMTEQPVGTLLREWRRRRRVSQLRLASDADISARHLSFVETGRARPSADMVVRLAEYLDVPLRERNDLLVAAGHAPQYRETSLDAEELGPVRDSLRLLLTAHEPCPAVVLDRRWNLVLGNRAVPLFLAGVAPHLLEPPVNVLRLALHPDGMAARITNLGEVRHHLLARLSRQALLTGDPTLTALSAELAGYPGGPPGEVASFAPLVPIRLRSEHGELSFFSTIATFGAPADITLSELAIETFHPADPATAAALRALLPSAALEAV